MKSVRAVTHAASKPSSVASKDLRGGSASTVGVSESRFPLLVNFESRAEIDRLMGEFGSSAKLTVYKSGKVVLEKIEDGESKAMLSASTHSTWDSNGLSNDQLAFSGQCISTSDKSVNMSLFACVPASSDGDVPMLSGSLPTGKTRLVRVQSTCVVTADTSASRPSQNFSGRVVSVNGSDIKNGLDAKSGGESKSGSSPSVDPSLAVERAMQERRKLDRTRKLLKTQVGIPARIPTAWAESSAADDDSGAGRGTFADDDGDREGAEKGGNGTEGPEFNEVDDVFSDDEEGQVPPSEEPTEEDNPADAESEYERASDSDNEGQKGKRTDSKSSKFLLGQKRSAKDDAFERAFLKALKIASSGDSEGAMLSLAANQASETQKAHNANIHRTDESMDADLDSELAALSGHKGTAEKRKAEHVVSGAQGSHAARGKSRTSPGAKTSSGETGDRSSKGEDLSAEFSSPNISQEEEQAASMRALLIGLFYDKEYSMQPAEVLKAFPGLSKTDPKYALLTQTLRKLTDIRGGVLVLKPNFRR